MLAAIRQWVIKTMMKGNTGVVQTMPKQQIIEMNVQITAERIMRNGINPEDLKTVGQVENVVNQIEQPKVNVNPGITSVKKADVLDMQGNKIPEGSKIMGGKAVSGTSSREKVKKEAVEKYGFTPERFDEIMDSQFDEKIGDDLLKESDAAIKARLDADNKKGIASIKNKPLDPDDVLPDYNETPGAFTRRNTPGSKENLLQELKIAYEKDFNRLRGDETVEELQRILKDLDKNGEPFADGGRIGLFAGSTKIPAVISRLLKNKKKVDQAVNDIFPTGDYKYDAQMAADAIVENNPKTFGNKLYEDLDMDTQMEVYGAVVGPIQSNALAVSRMKKATRPEKTLASMKEGKGINMSDPDIADKFARFMKETDPKGTEELEQKLQLGNFKTKDRSENADGGRIGLKAGMTKRAFLKLMGGVGLGIGAVKSGLLGLSKGAGKTVAKELTSVPIGNPEGMPVWFKPLVNKIIKEGDDVTKKFGTVDRQIVHTKKIDDFEEVTVYQDLNTGDVRLEYGPHLTDDTGKVIRASNEPEVIQLEYKAPEIIEPDIATGKGGRKTKEEFSAMEAEPEVVNWEGDIEMSGENVVNKVEDLITDTSKLQKYATDNKLTIKELSDSMKKQKFKKKLDSDPMEQVNYIENKQGMNAMDYIDEGTRVGDFDPKGYQNYDTKGMNLYDGIKRSKKASGGLAYMLGE